MKLLKCVKPFRIIEELTRQKAIEELAADYRNPENLVTSRAFYQFIVATNAYYWKEPDEEDNTEAAPCAECAGTGILLYDPSDKQCICKCQACFGTGQTLYEKK